MKRFIAVILIVCLLTGCSHANSSYLSEVRKFFGKSDGLAMITTFDPYVDGIYKYTNLLEVRNTPKILTIKTVDDLPPMEYLLAELDEFYNSLGNKDETVTTNESILFTPDKDIRQDTTMPVIDNKYYNMKTESIYFEYDDGSYEDSLFITGRVKIESNKYQLIQKQYEDGLDYVSVIDKLGNAGTVANLSLHIIPIEMFIDDLMEGYYGDVVTFGSNESHERYIKTIKINNGAYKVYIVVLSIYFPRDNGLSLVDMGQDLDVDLDSIHIYTDKSERNEIMYTTMVDGTYE